MPQEAGAYAALLDLVAEGLGFAIVTGSIGRLFLDDASYVPLVNPSATGDDEADAATAPEMAACGE